MLKHWIENSVEDRLAKEAVKILSSSKEEVESMVASNAFIITDMEKQAEEKGIKEGEKKNGLGWNKCTRLWILNRGVCTF